MVLLLVQLLVASLLGCSAASRQQSISKIPVSLKLMWYSASPDQHSRSHSEGSKMLEFNLNNWEAYKEIYTSPKDLLDLQIQGNVPADLLSEKLPLTIHLKRAKRLVAETFIRRSFDDHGVEIIQRAGEEERNIVRCLYGGEVANHPFSVVDLDLCYGLDGVIIIASSELRITNNRTEGKIQHYIEISRPLKRESDGIRCGEPVAMNYTQTERRTKRNYRKYFPRNVLFVEYVMVISKTFHDYINQSLPGTNPYNKLYRYLNLANSYLEQLGVYLILIAVEDWKNKDLIEMAPVKVKEDLYLIHEEFNRYRLRKMLPNMRHDLAQIFVAYEKGVAGLAYMNSVCEPKIGASVVSYWDWHDSQVPQTIAHEVGHTLGLNHVDGGSIDYKCSTLCHVPGNPENTPREEHCIMFSTLSQGKYIAHYES